MFLSDDGPACIPLVKFSKAFTFIGSIPGIKRDDSGRGLQGHQPIPVDLVDVLHCQTEPKLSGIIAYV